MSDSNQRTGARTTSPYSRLNFLSTLKSRLVAAVAPNAAKTFHVLYPEPDQGKEPEFDVLFFHGLQQASYENAWKHTWENDKGVLWPAMWLGKQDFPTARIISISYNSKAIGGDKTLDQIGSELLRDICYLEDVGKDRPVILVGHSLGGLTLKQLCVKAHREQSLPGSDLCKCSKAFCSNLAGAFFFATPHAGSSLAGKAKSVLGVVGRDGQVLPHLEALGRDTAILNREFDQAFRSLKLTALVETEEFHALGKIFPGLQVVQEGSAIQGMHTFFEVDEDHISICKPKTQDATTYRLLKKYIQETLQRFHEAKALPEAPRQEPQQRTMRQQADQEVKLSNMFYDKAEPSMKWFRKKQRELQPKLGDCWPLGLFSPEAELDELGDLEVTKHRVATMLFWDEVKTLHKNNELDDSFFEGKWMTRGQDYRLLVEPVDITNYYYRNLHLPEYNKRPNVGHYIDGISDELKDDNKRRPGRFILLQKMEQRVYGAQDPAYMAKSTLDLARLLKERIGNGVFLEYMLRFHGTNLPALDEQRARDQA